MCLCHWLPKLPSCFWNECYAISHLCWIDHNDLPMKHLSQLITVTIWQFFFLMVSLAQCLYRLPRSPIFKFSHVYNSSFLFAEPVLSIVCHVNCGCERHYICPPGVFLNFLSVLHVYSENMSFNLLIKIEINGCFLKITTQLTWLL